MTLAELQFMPPDLRPASAEIFLLGMACLILILDLFIKDAKRTANYVLTQLSLFGTALFVLAGDTGGAQYTFSGMFVSDPMGTVLKVTICGLVMLGLAYARGYLQDRPQLARGEYFTLTLFATLGMLVMVSANHLLSVYIGIELLSLALYAMVAFNRNSIPATEAAMKYFILGALASGILLYGISMVYGATGTLHLQGILEAMVARRFDPTILSFGLVFVVAGLAFKLGVVPFHMWIPDVYDGSPTAVTVFIASGPKLATFALLIRVLVNGFILLSKDWQIILLILAVLSMGLGNIAAITQSNIKRMLAYSAISHMGFMLLGMASGIVGPYRDVAVNAYSSSMFYIMTYALTSVGTFGMIMLLARAGVESDQIKDFAGLNKRNPWFAAIMLMLMFSLAGIPFFVGFFAKFAVLQTLILAGHLWLAILAVFFSLIGAYYYLRVVKVMYFDPPQDMRPVVVPFTMQCLLSANGIAVALLGILPNALMMTCVDVLSVSIPR